MSVRTDHQPTATAVRAGVSVVWFAASILLMLCAMLLAAPAQAQQTQTFTNAATILLPNPPNTGSANNSVPGDPASAYPSTISVSGMGSVISKLTVRINDFRHTAPDDIDMLLVGPQGQKMMIWSDVGGLKNTCSADPDDILGCNNTDIPGTQGITVTLDDSAPSDMQVPSSQRLPSGTFRPTNIGTVTDIFPQSGPNPPPLGPYSQPAPAGGATPATFASVFNGTNPNGNWRLYIIDDGYSFTGRIVSGWSLTITTPASLAATTTTITGDTPDPSDPGQLYTVSFQVSTATGSPTGTVLVSDGTGNTCSGAVISGSGSCQLSTNASGNRLLTATYSGDASYLTSSTTTSHFVLYATTTTITADTPDPSQVGGNVTVSYSVSASPAGGPAPTGTVSVSDGVNSCTGTVAAGSCTLPLQTVGTRFLNAQYLGDASNKGSTSASAVHAVKANPLLSITSFAPEPSDLGGSVTVFYSVSGSNGAPTGNVTISDGVGSCQATIATGQCSIATMSTPGDRTITATYAGDAIYNNAIASATHRVRYNTTTTITSHSPSPSGVGGPVTVGFTVTPTQSGGAAPVGSVTVSDGVGSCSAPANVGSCTITLNTMGTRMLSAAFAGDGFNRQSSSSSVAHAVLAPSTTSIVAVAPDPSDAGQGVAVTFSVSGSGAAPGGVVTVGDGVNSCTATLPQTQCTVPLSTSGQRSITVAYPGDSNYVASSASAVHTVRYNTTTALTGHSPNPSGTGAAVLATFVVTPSVQGGPAPTGVVNVSDGVNSCSAPANVGSCSIVLSTSGTRTLTATFAGDAFNKGSATGGVSHTVMAPSTTSIGTISPEPSDVGGNVTVTYAIGVSGPVATGSVTVSDGIGSCTAPVATGSCVLSLATPGQRTITATYAGDANYAGSTGSKVHTVRYGTITTITADTPDPSSIGQAVTVSYTVANNWEGAPIPSGNVTVTDGVTSCTGTVAQGSCLVPLSTSGNRTLTATYAGDGFNKGSASAGAAHLVKNASSVSVIADTPNPSNAGQSVVVSYSVSGTGATPTGTVTVSDGTISCSATVAAGSCAVAFATPGDRVVTVAYSGDATFAASSATVVHSVRYDTTTTLTGHAPNPSSAGQAVAVTFTVAPTVQGGPAPTGTVNVTDGVSSCSAAAAAGACSISLTTAGARTLSATYAGDNANKSSTSAGVAHAVMTAATLKIVSFSPEPSDIGGAVTIAYQVTGNSGTPTGTVTVADGFNSCQASVSAGQCTIGSLTIAGDRTLTASYSGDATYQPLSATAVHRVRSNAQISITGDTPNPSAIGQTVTVSFGVVASPQGGPAPTGNVTVSDGTTSCTAPVAAGACTLTFPTPGSRSISATYSGDGYNRPAQSNELSHSVKYGSLTTITSHSPAPSDVGQTILVHYAVTGNNGAQSVPTGNVSISDGNTSCVASVAAGQCAITLTVSGLRALTATYEGDATFTASAATVSHAAMYSTTTTIIGHSPSPSTPGQAVTVSFIVSQSGQGGAAATGTVSVTDGAVSCSATVAAGSCQLALTTPGSRSLVAQYSGDAGNRGSLSVAVQHQVTNGATIVISSTSPSPSVAGDMVTVNFSVTGTGATPTGSVSITDGTVSCSAPVAAAKCQLGFTVPGDKTLTASYTGDVNYASGTATATHRVLYPTTTTIAAHTPSPSTPGQAVVVSYAVVAGVQGGPALSGTVTVSDGVSACNASVAAGSCSITLTTGGQRTLTANYGGDASYQGSASSGTSHLVASPDLTISKTHAGNFIPGQTGATYSITVSNVGGASTSGTVTVVDNIPAGLTATGIAGSGWSCTQPAGPCIRNDALGNGASYPALIVTVNVAPTAPSTVTNTATVSGGADGNNSNNVASDPTSIVGGTLVKLTVTKWGSGAGVVTAQGGGIDCGASCSRDYAIGATVTLTATPANEGAVFTGWLGACSGVGACVVTLDKAKSVSANFGQAAYGRITLDIDDNKRADATTDVVLIIRYLFGLTGQTLVSGAIGANANRSDPAALLTFLDDIEPMLDIDGDGQTDALSDGMLIVRYLYGIRGAGLTQGSLGVGATRNGAQIEAYLKSLIP